METALADGNQGQALIDIGKERDQAVTERDKAIKEKRELENWVENDSGIGRVSTEELKADTKKRIDQWKADSIELEQLKSNLKILEGSMGLKIDEMLEVEFPFDEEQNEPVSNLEGWIWWYEEVRKLVPLGLIFDYQDGDKVGINWGKVSHWVRKQLLSPTKQKIYKIKIIAYNKE